MPIQHLSIIGTGLIGGSVALAAKQYINNCKISAYDADPSAVDAAIRLKAIDRSLPLAQVGADADLVILCTPVGQFEAVLREIAPSLSGGTILTDVGSTKRSITKLAEQLLPPGVEFIASHPMAGSEKRGMENAHADLFQRAVCMIMPKPTASAASVDLLEAFWAKLGMNVKRLLPEQHDRIVARISHLPQVVAMALAAIQSDETLAYAGKGFKDTTRIAGSSAPLWLDILKDNRQEVLTAMSLLRTELDKIERCLQTGDEPALLNWLSAASEKRRNVS